MAIILSRRASGESSGTVRSSVTDLSSAQILALFTTPIELVPAPGAGKCLVVVGGFSQSKFGTSAYVVINNVFIIYGTETAVGVYSFSSTSWDQAVSMINSGQFTNNDIPQASAEGEALNLFAAMGNPTLGDGTARVVTYYSVMTLA